MDDLIAYAMLILIGSGAVATICYSLSRHNAYRTDGIDNLGGLLRRWADRRVEHNRSVAQSYARRADEQNAQFLAGDERGIYGLRHGGHDA